MMAADLQLENTGFPMFRNAEAYERLMGRWSRRLAHPEDNRVEIFTQTPWHAIQPCRFDIDYDQPDAALKQATEAAAQSLPGFTSGDAWQESFRRRFGNAPAE
jgi:hypothetical protein